MWGRLAAVWALECQVRGTGRSEDGRPAGHPGGGGAAPWERTLFPSHTFLFALGTRAPRVALWRCPLHHRPRETVATLLSEPTATALGVSHMAVQKNDLRMLLKAASDSYVGLELVLRVCVSNQLPRDAAAGL